MEAHTFPSILERNKSQEEYKELWMSLFDINVISSCSEKDSDLFCASALLKTAFYKFIKLRKRLNEAEQLIECQKFELETCKLENKKISKSDSLRSSGCVHCRKLEDVIQLPEKSFLQLQPAVQSTDNPVENESKVQSRLFGEEMEKLLYSRKPQQNKTKLQIPNFVIPGIKPLDQLNLKNEGLKEINIFCKGTTISHSKNAVSNSSERGQEKYVFDNISPASKVQTEHKTPDKRKADSDVYNISPILKYAKKSRVSPGVVSKAKISGKKLHPKSPSLLPSETQPVGELLKKDAQGCMETMNESCLSRPFHPERKIKISPDSLRLKKPQITVSVSPDVNISTEGKISSNVEKSPNAQKSCSSPEKEEDEIIMPSPVTSQNRQSPGNPEIVTSPRKNYKINENEGQTMCSKNKRSNIIRKQRKMLPDTEATFFLPMEDLEALEDDCEDEQSDEEEDEVISQEKECDKKSREPLEGPIGLSSSFDRVPLKNNSPPYRYQRAAVRKKDERRKLFGWECGDCYKYYEAAGLGPAEKKMHLNKCSRHRDKFSPEKNPPEGFWNPLFPDTPK